MILYILTGIVCVGGIAACVHGVISTFRLAQYMKTDEYQEWRREHAIAQRDRWQSIVDSYEDSSE